MARTIRYNNARDKKELDSFTSGKRLKAYTKNNARGKFSVDKSSGKLGFSKLGKLITKNANRTLKKQARNQAKQFINEQLNETD